MRPAHPAGEQLFIEYSGDTMPTVNAGTGEIRRAAILVGVPRSCHNPLAIMM